MSTQIRCVEPLCNRETPNDFTLDVREPHATLDEVFIRLNGDRSLPGHYVSRVDFLAAVETECGVRMVPGGAIVIDRAELPEVTEDGEVDGTGGKVARFQCDGTSGFADSPPWRHRQIGISHLALAEYLDAHPSTPPVDEAQVSALWSALAQWGVQIVGGASLDGVARKLVVEGWSK